MMVMKNMDKFKRKKNRKFAFILTTTCLTLFVGGSVFNVLQGKFSNRLNAAEVEKTPGVSSIPSDLKTSMSRAFKGANDWPSTFLYNNKKLDIKYSFNTELDAYIKKLLKSYRSDYATVSVIDNETGEVLAAVGLEGKSNKLDTNLILTATHPSASLIKMITAAELIQNAKITRETPFEFRGRSTTLFKYQLAESKNARWDKTQTFETAFAKSNNVIFGKAAIAHMNIEKLTRMAENFGYNQPVIQELDFLQSHFGTSNDDYRLAEMASGFNDETVISPIHAAAMASIVANGGVMRSPRLVSKVVDHATGQSVWENTVSEKRVLAAETAKEMHEMMAMTIDDGTARKSFRRMNNGYKNALEIGGKTGSITGGVPFGKRDWFAAFAIPRDNERGKGISISVMNVNVKKWHVKSTMLAKNIIEYYYNNIKPMPITMVKMPRYIGENTPRKAKKYKRSIASVSQSKNKKKPASKIKKIGKRNERKSNSAVRLTQRGN